MQAIISEIGELYVTKRWAYIRFLRAYNPISIINYGKDKKNIPTQILTDKYGFGV